MGLQSRRFLPQLKNSHDSKYGVDMTEVRPAWWTSKPKGKSHPSWCHKGFPASLPILLVFSPKMTTTTPSNIILAYLVSKVREVFESANKFQQTPLKTYRMANAVSWCFPKISKGKIKPLVLNCSEAYPHFIKIWDHVLVRFGGVVKLQSVSFRLSGGMEL